MLDSIVKVQEGVVGFDTKILNGFRDLQEKSTREQRIACTIIAEENGHTIYRYKL